MDSDFRGGIRVQRAVYRRPSVVVLERRTYTRISRGNDASGRVIDMVRVPVQVPQGGSYRPTHLPMASSEQPGIVRQEKYIAVVEDAPQTAKGTSAGAARPSWNLMHMRWVLGGFGLVILLIGTLLTLQAFSANRAVERQLVKLQQQTSNSSGSSSLPTDTKPKDPSYVDNNCLLYTSDAADE